MCDSHSCGHIQMSASQVKLQDDLNRREIMAAQNAVHIANITEHKMHVGIDKMAECASKAITKRNNEKKLLLLRRPK